MNMCVCVAILFTFNGDRLYLCVRDRDFVVYCRLVCKLRIVLFVYVMWTYVHMLRIQKTSWGVLLFVCKSWVIIDTPLMNSFGNYLCAFRNYTNVGIIYQYTNYICRSLNTFLYHYVLTQNGYKIFYWNWVQFTY